MAVGDVVVGALRYWLELQTPTGTSGDGYETQDTVRGEVRGAGGNEILRFGGPSATGQYVITIRFRTDVKADWRIKDVETGRKFQIANYADPDGRMRWLSIYCQELQ